MSKLDIHDRLKELCVSVCISSSTITVIERNTSTAVPSNELTKFFNEYGYLLKGQSRNVEKQCYEFTYKPKLPEFIMTVINRKKEQL